MQGSHFSGKQEKVKELNFKWKCSLIFNEEF